MPTKIDGIYYDGDNSLTHEDLKEMAKLEGETRDFPAAALKFDEGKPDLSQVSSELMEHLARVRMFGEKKYARNNWKKGFKVTRSLAAALRHIFATLRGELYDPESGLYHIAHAIASLEHALYDLVHHKENIDV